jgi:hypothetical protein
MKLVLGTGAVLAALCALLPVHAAAEGVRCHETDGFRVIERPVADGPGADFLVRPLAQPTPGDMPCRFDAGPGDFMIPHTDAERFRALAGPVLVIDNGTGPNGREIIVWHLGLRRKVLQQDYGGLVSTDTEQVVFWRPTATAPTPGNCPQLAQWKAQLLGAAIEVQVRLRLSDLSLRDLAVMRCAVRQ